MTDAEIITALESIGGTAIDCIVACCWAVEEHFDWSPNNVTRLAELLEKQCNASNKDTGMTALAIITSIHRTWMKKVAN